MSKAYLLHATALIIATIGTYFWIISETLTSFTLQLTAILVLTYIIAHRLYKNHNVFKKTVITLDLTILTTVVLLLISATGGLSSPLFFTVYFLLFAVAMLFATTSTLILTANICVFFILSPTTNLANLSHLTELIAVIMITPLAILTSHQHEELVLAQSTNHTLNKSLKNEESNTLLFLSLNLKQTLTHSLDALSQIIPQSTSPATATSLKTVYSDLKALYHSANDLQKSIDQETDSKPQ